MLISLLLASSQPPSTRWLLILDVPQLWLQLSLVTHEENFFGSGYMLPIPAVCYFCYMTALNKDVTRHCYHLFCLAHHCLVGRYTSSISFYGRMDLKTCTICRSYSSPQLKSRQGGRNWKVSATAEEKFLFHFVWGGYTMIFWRIRSWASTEGEPQGNSLLRLPSTNRLLWTAELAEEMSGRKAAFNLKCGTVAETIAGGSLGSKNKVEKMHLKNMS